MVSNKIKRDINKEKTYLHESLINATDKEKRHEKKETYYMIQICSTTKGRKVRERERKNKSL